MNRKSFIGCVCVCVCVCVMSAGASAQLAFMPKIDAELARPSSVNALYESSRWVAPGQAPGEESVAPLLRPDGSFSIARFTGASEPVELVESGDVAYMSGGTTWVFGGNLDDSDQYGTPPVAFRGVSANGLYVAFWAGLVAQGTPLLPVPAAQKVGIFRLYLVGSSPVVEAIAIDGEPVSDFSPDTTFYALFPDAVWRLPIYEEAGSASPEGTVVPGRYEPRLGKSAGVALNPIGRIAFRAAVTIPGEEEPDHGVIFAEDSEGDLRFVAIEKEDSALIVTGLGGVGNVKPTTLGRPAINEDGVIAFYALTKYSNNLDGSALFHWDDGVLTTLMHTNMSPSPAALGVFRVEWSSGLIFTSACGVEGFFVGWFSDQPSLNCDGQVAFRAYVTVNQFESERESVWRWTNDGAHGGLGTYERIFTEGDPMPGGGSGAIGIMPKTLPDPFGVFARPSINGFGEIACQCGIEITSFDREKAVLLLDRDGVKRTIARTNSGAHEFLDVNGVARTTTELGDRDPNSLSISHDLSLNDRGQAAFAANFGEGNERAVLFYTEVLAAGAGLGAAIHSGATYTAPSGDVPILNGMLEGHTYLGFGAGAAGDGDATLTREGVLAWDVRILLYDDILYGVFATQLPKTPACAADVNQDNVCDSADLGQMLAMYGQQCSGCPEDINGDGVVDTADLGLFLGVFGRYCAACEEFEEGSPESLMVDGGGESLLKILGFDDLEDLKAWLSVTSERDREAFIEDAVEVISLAK